MKEPVSLPLQEFAKPIYEQWDKDKTLPPPKGYKSWLDYLENGFKKNDKPEEILS